MQWRMQLREDSFEFGAAYGEGLVAQIAIFKLKQIEEDNRGRQLCSECLHTRSSGMDAQCQRVKVQTAIARDDDLTVEDASLRELLEQSFAQLREVAIQRLAVTALDQQLVSVAKDHGAKSIPFRLEDPRVCVGWNFIHSLGEHGEDRRWQGEWHGVLDAGYRLGSFEDEEVVVLVALGEVVLLDEAEAGALDFGDDDVGVDAVVGAVAGVVDDAEEAAGLH